MTYAFAPAAVDPPAGRRAVVGLCSLSLCLMVCLSVADLIVGGFVDPVGSVRGRIAADVWSNLGASGTTVAPFHLQAANLAERDRAVRCLTDAIYYEAAHEPVDGQRAIAQVVINRLRDRHFPKSVCGVVYEGWERRTGCQFSFVCDGSIARRRANPAAWDRLRPLAEEALDGYVAPEVGTATHYHAVYVRPNWIRSVAEIASIGKHIFYKWKGRAGMPSALGGVYAGGEFQIADQALDGMAATTTRGHAVAHDSRREGLGLRGHRREMSFRLAAAHTLRARMHGGRYAARSSIRLT